MIKLFISDLDGTLLYNEGKMSHSVSQDNKNAIKKLEKKGIHFAIATGRSIDFLWKIFEDRSLYYDTIGFGGNIIRFQEDIIEEITYNDDEMREIISVLTPYQDHCSIGFVDHNNDYLSLFKNDEIRDYFAMAKRKQHLCDIHKFIEKDSESFFQDLHLAPCRAYIDCKTLEDVAFMRELIHEKLPQYIPIMSSPKSMELMKLGIDKATGIEKLANYLNIESNEIAVIGDSENDAAMIDHYACSFKMTHGSKALNARYTVDHVHDAIEKVLSMNSSETA